ncbi:MAG: hypothetical protein MUF64_25975 [Polyangiaceae bacterium]|nr:hypothetical protein [Polyangiaceae bacterium]
MSSSSSHVSPSIEGGCEARVAVARDKYAKGFQPGQEQVPAVYEVLELRKALHRVYPKDAHLVAYLVEGTTLQPRVNKPGLALFGKRLTVEVFFCDLDNPNHDAWTPESFEAARLQDQTLPSLSTAGVYYTRRGRRAVQPLLTPLEVPDVERYLEAWLTQLEQDGLAVDWSCTDWTRHFRLPNVAREPGGRSRCIDLSRMVPIALPELPPLPPPDSDASGRPVRTRRPRGPAGPITWTTTLPEPWLTLVEPLAQAVRGVTTEWHSLFLALAGAMLGRKVPPEHVPALCRAISLATASDDRAVDRERSAQSSVLRWQTGLPMVGFNALVQQWPAVADALSDVLARGQERRMREQVAAAATEPMLSLEETTRRLEEALRKAPDGLTLIQAGCGLGKTRAAEKIAAERAATPYVTKDAKGLRAPPFSKTSISVDKHALARQVVEHLGEVGTPAGRHFGPLSLRDESGRPVCKFHEVGEQLVAGGLSIKLELCEGRGKKPCPHAQECPARPGYEGPERPRVRVGPHALMDSLDAGAGGSGLLVIDEPPSPLETLVFMLKDLEATLTYFIAFQGDYTAALRPLLETMRLWLMEGTNVGETTTFEEVVKRWGSKIPPEVLEEGRRWSKQPKGDALQCAEHAPVDEDHEDTPPVRWEYLDMAREDPARARRLGQAARVLGAMHHGAISQVPVAVRIENRGRGRLLHMTRIRPEFVSALRREGSAVVLDAGVDLWAPVYAKIVGYQPPLLRFHAPDGAPVERTILRLRSATRTSWCPHGTMQVTSSLETAVRLAIEWALEKPGNGVLALISIPTVELALEAALRPDDASLEARWKEQEQEPEVLAEMRNKLGPLLQRWPGKILFGHYGALRGLDGMAEADNLITLGDPWVNLGDVKNDCLFLGLEDWEARYELLCRGELEQAHGRLRTVHRKRPGRALHVGAIAPGGPLWSGEAVRVVPVEQQLAASRAAMPATEFAAAVKEKGGIRPMARWLGIDAGEVSRMARGLRAVSAKAAEKIRVSAPDAAPAASTPNEPNA